MPSLDQDLIPIQLGQTPQFNTPQFTEIGRAVSAVTDIIGAAVNKENVSKAHQLFIEERQKLDDALLNVKQDKTLSSEYIIEARKVQQNLAQKADVVARRLGVSNTFNKLYLPYVTTKDANTFDHFESLSEINGNDTINRVRDDTKNILDKHLQSSEYHILGETKNKEVVTPTQTGDTLFPQKTPKTKGTTTGVTLDFSNPEELAVELNGSFQTIRDTLIANGAEPDEVQKASDDFIDSSRDNIKAVLVQKYPEMFLQGMPNVQLDVQLPVGVSDTGDLIFADVKFSAAEMLEQEEEASKVFGRRENNLKLLRGQRERLEEQEQDINFDKVVRTIDEPGADRTAIGDELRSGNVNISFDQTKEALDRLRVRNKAGVEFSDPATLRTFRATVDIGLPINTTRLLNQVDQENISQSDYDEIISKHYRNIQKKETVKSGLVLEQIQSLKNAAGIGKNDLIFGKKAEEAFKSLGVAIDVFRQETANLSDTDPQLRFKIQKARNVAELKMMSRFATNKGFTKHAQYQDPVVLHEDIHKGVVGRGEAAVYKQIIDVGAENERILELEGPAKAPPTVDLNPGLDTLIKAGKDFWQSMFGKDE